MSTEGGPGGTESENASKTTADTNTKTFFEMQKYGRDAKSGVTKTGRNHPMGKKPRADEDAVPSGKFFAFVWRTRQEGAKDTANTGLESRRC